jgi:hypothetical protein
MEWLWKEIKKGKKLTRGFSLWKRTCHIVTKTPKEIHDDSSEHHA